MASKRDIGTWWQDKFWELLGGWPHDGMLFKHRFKDAKSAGTVAVGRAPGDFLVGFDRGAYMVEVKASKKHASLRSCFSSIVEDHQVASLFAWSLAGNPGFILFYSDMTAMVEYWPVSELKLARKTGRPLNTAMSKHFPIEDFNCWLSVLFMDARDDINTVRRMFA